MRASSGIAGAILMLAVPGAVSADPLPVIIDVTLDPSNHAVVTWTKTTAQGSNAVKWTTDPTLGTFKDGTYGGPLADCQTPARPDPSGDAQYLYGSTCKGDDVASSATKHITRQDMQVGTYYFQVTVAGTTTHDTGALVSSAPHYSGVFKLTVTPAKGGGNVETTETTKTTADRNALAEATVTGKVEIGCSGDEVAADPCDHRWVTGPMTITEFAEIKTGATPARLAFEDGSVLAFGKHTTATFDRGMLAIGQGRLWYSSKGRPRAFFKEVSAGIAYFGDIRIARAATFSLHVMPDDTARVRVYKGAITAVGSGRYQGSRVRVAEGFEARLQDRQPPSTPGKITPESPFWK